MSWRNEYENIPWDIQDLEKWKQEMSAYQSLQLKYHALRVSYKNLYEMYKKETKKDVRNTYLQTFFYYFQS